VIEAVVRLYVERSMSRRMPASNRRRWGALKHRIEP